MDEKENGDIENLLRRFGGLMVSQKQRIRNQGRQVGWPHVIWGTDERATKPFANLKFLVYGQVSWCNGCKIGAAGR